MRSSITLPWPRFAVVALAFSVMALIATAIFIQAAASHSAAASNNISSSSNIGAASAGDLMDHHESSMSEHEHFVVDHELPMRLRSLDLAGTQIGAFPATETAAAAPIYAPAAVPAATPGPSAPPSLTTLSVNRT